MASVDITSVIIEAKSQGVDAATKSLNNLADAADKAEKSTGKFSDTSKNAGNATATTVSAADKLLATYQKQTDLLGANISQQMAYNVALKGGTDAQILIAQQLGAQQDAYKRLAADQAEAIKMNKAMDASLQGVGASSGHASGSLSGITRELIVMGHEISQGQTTRLGGSMIVMAERADLGGRAVRAFTTAVEAAGGSITAVLAPIAAVVAAVGVLAAGFMTWFHSVQAVHEFNKELILTGGYAGKSANELYTMSDSIGKVYGNIGAAREAMTKLVSTGKFSADQINDITKAAVGLYTYGGVAIDKTIAQFEKLSKEPLTNTERSYSQVSKAAMELDQSMHFLEPTVMKAIIDQEKLGNLHEASAIATKALADEETKRAKELEENMTALGKLAHTVGAAFTNMWNSLWTKESPQQKLAGVVEQLKKLPSDVEAGYGIFGGNVAVQLNIEKRKALMKEAAGYQVQIMDEMKKAQDKAAKDEANTEANLAGNYFRQLEDKAKGEDRFTQEKLKYDRELEASAGTVFERSKEQQEKDIALLHKLYDEKHKVKALGFADINLEISSIKSATQAQLDAADMELKSIKTLADARKINVFQQQKETDDALQLKLTALKEGEKAELTAIANDIARKGRSATEIKELQNKYVQAYTTSEKAINGVNEALQKNDTLVSELAGKAADAQAQANAKVIDSIKASVTAVQAKIDAYNRLPESVKKAGVTEKQIQDEITQSYIDNLQAELDQTIANNNVEEPMAKARIEFLKQEIQLKQQLKSKQLEEETIQATNKAAQDYVTAWKQANKQIGDDLAAAIIDGGGKGWKKLIKDMEMAFAKMILRPILEPISSAIANITTTLGPSSPATASGSIGVAQTASNIYSMLSKGFDTLGTTVANGVQYAINAVGASGSQQIGNSMFAQTIGEYAGKAAGFAVGQTLNKAISGQYQVGSGFSKAETIATAVASYFGPEVGAITGAISGAINRLFGMGSKNITQQGVSGMISETGTTGQAYQDWTQKGGIFRSNKSGQDTQALSMDVINTFTSGLTSMKASSTDFAKSMNVSSDALKNYSKSFDIQFVGLQQVKGTAAEQAAIIQSNAKIQQDAITKFFTTMGDDMATKLIPNIMDFAKQGETASVTLQRLSDTFKTTNAVMDLFGINSEKVFGGLGLESAKARQYLVDLAGGISNLGSQATFYAQNFLTAQEQIAPVQKAVTNALDSLGLDKLAISLSDTSLSASDLIGKFKDIVNGLNLVDPAQAQLFESLMQLAPAFKQVADAADAAKAAAEAQAKATHDAAVASAKNLAQNDFNALSASITTAKNNAQAAYDAQSAILNAQISSLTATKEAITQLSTALDNTLHTMVDNTVMAMSRVQAQNLLDQALTTAKTTGKLPSAEDLKDVLSTLSKDPAAQYSSYADYIKDVGITAGKVTALNDIAKKQGTVADKQLTVAQQQLVQAKSSLDQELAKYDMMLSFAQQQLDAANGTNVAIKTLADAIAAFNTSVLSAIQAQKGAIGSNGQEIASVAATTEDITKIYQNVLGRQADAGGLAYWQQQASNGMTPSEITQWFMKSPEYLSTHPNGSHANGLDNVPFDGYTAKLHKGEMVLPAKQAKGVVQGGDVKELADSLKKSNDELIAVNTAMKDDIRWLKKLYQQLTPSGDRLQMHDIGAAS